MVMVIGKFTVISYVPTSITNPDAVLDFAPSKNAKSPMVKIVKTAVPLVVVPEYAGPVLHTGTVGPVVPAVVTCCSIPLLSTMVYPCATAVLGVNAGYWE